METAYHSELLLGQVPALDQACFQIQRHVADPNFRGTHLCRVLGFGRLAIFQTCGFSALLGSETATRTWTVLASFYRSRRLLANACNGNDLHRTVAGHIDL